MTEKITHQKIRGILKRADLKVGHYSDNRLGMAFFYGGNISVQQDWRNSDGVKVGCAESQGSRCEPIDREVVADSINKVVEAIKSELPNVSLVVEDDSVFIQYGEDN